MPGVVEALGPTRTISDARGTLPVTIRPARPGDNLAWQDDGRRPMTGYLLLAELDGAPLAVVAVDGGWPPADPVARAEHAVRVLLLYRDEVISDARRRARGSS